MEDANSRMNCKFKNNGQEGRLDEEYESGGNEEDKLMAFNRAFQDAILATMDREISTYEEELIDKTAQMAAISQSKEDLAIALLDEKKRSNMLNSAVLTAKKNMKEQANEITIAKLENDGPRGLS